MFPNDSWMMMVNQSPSPSSSSSWSRHQDKLFEGALVVIPEETPDRWDKIAAQVPGKSSSEVRRHYEDLVHDVAEIDSGRVELPLYEDESCGPPWASDSRAGQVSFSPRPRQSESERKKGVPWTEEEHRRKFSGRRGGAKGDDWVAVQVGHTATNRRATPSLAHTVAVVADRIRKRRAEIDAHVLFLIGLQRYGKGDWRSISRNAVVSRTPTQVASHAQKYFMRLTSGKKDKKRSSIHDITTVDTSNSLPHSNTQTWVGESLASQIPYYEEGPPSFGFSM
ncbi:Transcription factor SRM1 [Vitis vinifera]|uniref:Transcription factor SRM1 n=1 Tax=Vitis vinifera TaxID=29760 RepID=A0A438HQF6_VITVI|nr:Transcription factor SRM1 [Vitis vinifera]